MQVQSFRFLKGGPTSWGYIIILIIITFIAAGGVLGYARYVFEELNTISQSPLIEIELEGRTE